MPSHALVAERGSIRIYQYWQPERQKTQRASDFANGAVAPLLEDAVKIRMMSDVPIGAFLSGGIDSSAVVSLMAQASAGPVKTVALVFEEMEFDERAHSRKIAKHLGTDHQEVTITEEDMLRGLSAALKAMDQPTVDGINSYFVSQAAKSAGLTVVLSGLGGDELFGGYESFRVVPYMQRYRSASRMLPCFFKNRMGKLFRTFSPDRDRHTKIADVLAAKEDTLGHPYFAMRSFFSKEKISKLLGSECNFWEHTEHYSNHSAILQKAKSMDLVNQVSYFELMTYMRDMLLRDTDFMSMAHSLEVRVPLIDYRLVELMLSILGKQKLNRVGPKHLLWQSLKQPLPASVINRPKQGFTLPFSRWLKQRLRAKVGDVLLTPCVKTSHFINQQQVEVIWATFISERTSWHRVWILYVLKKWVEKNL